MEHGVIHGNTANDGGNLVSEIINEGDVFDSNTTSNTMNITGGGNGIVLLDGARDSFSNNNIDGFGNGFGAFTSAGIGLGTSANPLSDVIVTNNTVHFTSGTAGVGIEIISNTSGQTTDDNRIANNDIYGTNSTGQIGIQLTEANSGTGNDEVAENNNLYNLPVGVEGDAGLTNTILRYNTMHSVTAATATKCGGTTPFCDELDFARPFTLSSGTGTIVLPQPCSTLVGYTCQDTTLLSNPATLAFTSSTNSACTLTVTGTTTNTGFCTGQIY